MLGKNHIDILDTPQAHDIPAQHIDKELLKQHLGDSSTYYYICGPDKFTSSMIENLLELGVENPHLVFEQ
jgi:ferredoxin-NADP reductase